MVDSSGALGGISDVVFLRCHLAGRESSQATAGVAQTDLDGRFVVVNARYCEMVRYIETELLRMNKQAITHPEDRRQP